MKKLYVIGLTLGAIALCTSLALSRQKVSGYLYRTTGLCDNSTPTFDLGEIDRLSVQVTYSSGTYAAVSFTDGSKSTVNITVSSAAYVFNSTPTLTINGVNVSYTPVATSTGTAKAISDAIMANSSLNTIIVSTYTTNITGVVWATSTVTGVNAYTVTSSSWAALTPSNFRFVNGVASDVDSTNDTITKTNTFMRGQGVVLSTTTNVAMSGLSWGTTYFAIPYLAGTSFKLASSLANATAGTAIDISTGTVGGGAFVLTAQPYSAGSAGFAWQASNDNSNWWTIPSISSVSVSGSGTNNVGWDFGDWNYRYLRLNFTGPTRGCVVIDAAMEGKDFGN